MSDLIWFLVFALVFCVVAYKRYSLTTCLGALTATMLIGSIVGSIGILGWLLFAVIALPIAYKPIRLEHISTKLLAFYKSVSPEMSDTEQEAIDAGTVWWDGELFSGKPNWQKLHNIASPRLSSEEQAFLDGPCETVCSMVNEWQINHVDADLSDDIWAYLKEHKFFAMIIEKKYGGLAFSAYAQSRVLQKLAGVSAVLSSTVGVPNSLGPGELLQHYGTEEQQNHYLPRLANGDEIPCFALTSPEAGSDAGAIPDTGIVTKGKFEGKEVLGMRLTFSKRYITLAPIATVVGLAFKLHDPDGLLGDKKELGITCALIPRDTDGLKIGRRHFPLNVPFHNGPLQAEDMFVPISYIIGGEKMAGKGWRMLMECLSVGRCITLPSSAAGGAKQLALTTGAYSRIRRQFKMPIGQMEGVEEMLGRIGGSAYMMDAVTSLSTAGVDLGEKPSVISAICKYHLTERMRTIVNDSMDIHGGKGICLGPNNYLGRAYQGVPISITVEGANILTRNMMIFGQGAMRCHPYVLQEIYAAQQEDKQKQLEDFDTAVFGHIGFAICNTVRTAWFTLSRNVLSSAPFKDETARYYKRLQGYSANLALLTDISMGVLGGSLKRRERLSARLGDVLSQLYLASATLKRFDEQGRNKEDLPFLNWALQDSLYQIDVAIDDFIRNFPNSAVSVLLRIIVQPFGKLSTKPSDVIEHKIAHILQTPNSARSRLGDGQYLSRVEGNLFGDLEQTLENIVKVEPLFKKICKSLGKSLQMTQLDQLAEQALKANIISQEEAQLLIDTEAGRLRTINVDDFDPQELVSATSKVGVTAAPKRSPRKKPSAKTTTKPTAKTPAKAAVSKAKPKAPRKTKAA
ncbi:acyl-CoA dehydrogenase FadE [Glaciecola petra]|uniref:Acyl-coenzyme A dehydrogenase n=1 Tax=Glaciecola petra TaxID=3075602 RepID=A0ABU2ZQI6_9ALTE|nr:acyl-CoA dehydrogenase FadE [Aestuariibacter sp. P117]MDT0594308.1 acyl-CoA dehydrogenase FadE [Aestuariibacter sp. P117]